MERGPSNLRIRTRRGHEVIPAGPGTLLARLIAAGVPVASSCSGRGSCGRCMVEVLEGAADLSAMDVHEALVLDRNHAPPMARLSCCCRVERPAAVVTVATGYW
jgi:ferredoxin